MSLILLRHTRPLMEEGLCYGRTDLSLAGDFTDSAMRIAAQLPDFKMILSSPLSRCRRLAEAIGAARGQDITLDPRLTEMDFGDWESRLWTAIPRAEIDAWRDDFLDARPHGGESVRQLADRVQAALDDAVRGPVPVLVVTHSGVIKAARAARGEAEGWQSQTAFGQWFRTDWP